MNARRNISAPPASRNYLERYAAYSGEIKKPVLTVHTVIDELVPVAHQSVYRETVAAAGESDLLAQAYTSGIGHCIFSAPQVVAAVHALDAWIATGVAPTDASFPAALGFVPGLHTATLAAALTRRCPAAPLRRGYAAFRPNQKPCDPAARAGSRFGR
jgi:hypothetical protein